MLQSVKSGASSVKSSIVSGGSTIKSFFSKHGGKIIKILLVFGAIAMIVSMVLSAFAGVKITGQGVIINHTQERLMDGSVSNQIKLIGLGSSFYVLPKRKYLIYFSDSSQINSEYKKEPITARVEEGTKVTVSATIQCQIVVQNLRNFLQEYGLNWFIYPIEKTKNVIIQQIQSTKFYQLNNTLLISQINSQFNTYASIQSYPFVFQLINIRIKYPDGSFSISNTLGINLLQEKSLLSQYQRQYDTLNNKMNANLTTLQTSARDIGTLEGKIKKQQLQVQAIKTDWLRGLEVCESMFGGSQQAIRKYVWTYFQNVYNSTYKG